MLSKCCIRSAAADFVLAFIWKIMSTIPRIVTGIKITA